MGLGLFLDNICIFIGTFVVWLYKGGTANLLEEYNKKKQLLWFSKEAMLGLVVLSGIIGLIWVCWYEFTNGH